MFTRVAIATFAMLSVTAIARGEIRQWSDATGKYTVEAELIAASHTTAVLQNSDHKLSAVAIEHLSDADREYIDKWHEQQETADPQEPSTWTMQSGLQVKAWAVAYDRREVTFQRHRGKLYVNDRQFENLPAVYQKMLPKIVGHYTQREMETTEDLMEWARLQRARPTTFTVEGVLLQLENGDRYLVPFFFFSSADMAVLEPGWQRWLAQQAEAEAKQHENFLLQAQAEAYQRNQQANQQITQLQLQMLAVDAGIVDLWEVRLVPRPGTRVMPSSVIVPARNSRDAAQAAQAANPQYTIGPIARVR